MAEYFPRHYQTPFMEEGYYGGQKLEEDARQNALKSQLMNLKNSAQDAAIILHNYPEASSFINTNIFKLL